MPQETRTTQPINNGKKTVEESLDSTLQTGKAYVENAMESAQDSLKDSVDEVKQKAIQESRKLSGQVDKLTDRVKAELKEKYTQGTHLLEEKITGRSYGFGSLVLLFAAGVVLGKSLR